MRFSFVAQEWAMDGLIEHEGQPVLRFWFEPSGLLQEASTCCGATFDTVENVRICYKCHRAAPYKLHPSRLHPHEYDGLYAWLLQAGAEVERAHELAMPLAEALIAMRGEAQVIHDGGDDRPEHESWDQLSLLAARWTRTVRTGVFA